MFGPLCASTTQCTTWAVGAGDVESEKAMRIRPEPLGDDLLRLHCQSIADVELRRAVVCQQGDRTGSSGRG